MTLNALNPRWEGLVRRTEEHVGGFSRLPVSGFGLFLGCFESHHSDPERYTLTFSSWTNTGGRSCSACGPGTSPVPGSHSATLEAETCRQMTDNRCRTEHTAGAQPAESFCVSARAPEAQLNVVGHGVPQSLQNQCSLWLWNMSQVKSHHLQADGTGQNHRKSPEH